MSGTEFASTNITGMLAIDENSVRLISADGAVTNFRFLGHGHGSVLSYLKNIEMFPEVVFPAPETCTNILLAKKGEYWLDEALRVVAS